MVSSILGSMHMGPLQLGNMMHMHMIESESESAVCKSTSAPSSRNWSADSRIATAIGQEDAAGKAQIRNINVIFEAYLNVPLVSALLRSTSGMEPKPPSLARLGESVLFTAAPTTKPVPSAASKVGLPPEKTCKALPRQIRSRSGQVVSSDTDLRQVGSTLATA